MMNMSSEQAALAAAVESFIYQNFDAEESGSAAPVDISIFERPIRANNGHGGGRPVIETGASEAEVKNRVAAAFDSGFEAGRKETVADAEQKIADARESITENLKE